MSFIDYSEAELRRVKNSCLRKVLTNTFYYARANNDLEAEEQLDLIRDIFNEQPLYQKNHFRTEIKREILRLAEKEKFEECIWRRNFLRYLDNYNCFSRYIYKKIYK